MAFQITIKKKKCIVDDSSCTQRRVKMLHPVNAFLISMIAAMNVPAAYINIQKQIVYKNKT